MLSNYNSNYRNYKLAIKFKISLSSIFRSPIYLHLPSAAVHFSSNSLFSTAAINGSIKNALIVFSTVLKSSVLVSIFLQNAFHFFCIASSFGKSHNLLKLFYRKGVSTIFKSLFKCFCQRCTVKIELIGKIINIIIIFHSA